MTASLDQMARDAGFRKPGEAQTCNVDPEKPFGIDLFETRLTPEGWIGMRTDKGVTCLGPNGESFFVPTFDPDEFMRRKFMIDLKEKPDA